MDTAEQLELRITRKADALAEYEKLGRQNQLEPNPLAVELVRQIKALRDNINLELRTSDDLLIQLRQILLLDTQ